MFTPSEHDYFMEEVSHKKTSSSSCPLNVKETELRLGLPGCESPERKSSASGVSLFGKDLQDNNNKGNLQILNYNLVASGVKKRCIDDDNGFSGKWVFSVSDDDDASQVDLGKGASFFTPIVGLKGQYIKNSDTQNTSQSAKSIQDIKPEVAPTK